MDGISREKIALIVFVACILLIVAGIAAYLVAGHSWNVAASRIDDAAGEMEGYHVILYEGTAIPSSSRIDGQGRLAAPPVSLAAVRADYEGKDASVYLLDLVHPRRYDDPLILDKDGYRIGIVNVNAGDTPVQMQDKVDFLAAHDVDTVIAITPAQSLLAKVDGVDAYIDLNERTPLATGKSSADGYRIAMPEAGTVGAIVISPSEVLSARTVSDSG